MRHRVAGRKLGRTTAHRQAVLRNLSTALFDKERITTTLAKAKELRPFVEKLVTLSKRETLHARRRVLTRIKDKRVVAKLFDSLSARFATRPGGYTRIIKLGPRRGDHAEMAIIELVEAEVAAKTESAGSAKKSKARRAKRPTAKGAAKKGKATETTEKKKKPSRKKRAAKKAEASSEKSEKSRAKRTARKKKSVIRKKKSSE